MNKKIISLLICLVLIFSLSVTAYATNVDAIQPDTNIIVVGVTDHDVPVYGSLPTHREMGSTVIIIPGERLEGTYTNPITNKPVENNNTETNTKTEDVTIEDEVIPTTESLVQDIFELTNKERVAAELEALAYNKGLQEAADIRAKEIAKQFSHTRPDGTSCHSIVTVDYEVTGENIIKADNPIATAEKMMEAWMNSESHRDNILLADFTSMAVGAYTEDGVTYAVQIFVG